MKLIGKATANNGSNLKLPGARRADLFCKMALRACLDASHALLFPDEDPETGIIVATQFGPHATTFKFLDGLLAHSDKKVSPTLFSHSVHNAAASYIATALNIRGAAMTLTCFEDPLTQALSLANTWLERRRVQRVIVCYVEERSAPFDHIRTQCSLPSYSKDGIQEGAVALILTHGEGFSVPDSIDIEKNFNALEIFPV